MYLLPAIITLAAACQCFSQFDTRVKVDNEYARVLVVTSQPGEKSQPHEHKMNRVMVYLDAGKMTLNFTDGTATALNFKANQVLWSPATREHTSHNESEHPVRIAEIELKDRPKSSAVKQTGPLDWVKVDPRRYKVELENDQVRVVRVHYGPHEKGAPHEHPYSFVAVYLSSGSMGVTPEGKAPVKVGVTPGTVKFARGSRHVEENLADTPLDLVVVEFKE